MPGDVVVVTYRTVADLAAKATFDPREHEWRGDGWRQHVISYGLRWESGRLVGFRRCSEPECEVNREARAVLGLVG